MVVKEILFRAAERKQIPVTLVANHAMRVPPSKLISLMQVSSGFDVADDEIVRRAQAGHIVITSDIPLAAELVPNDVLVLSPRGERFTAQNIGAKLNMRDFMETMRSSAVEMGGGPPPFSQTDRREFANQLDRLLAKI